MSESEMVEVNFDGLVGPTHHYAGLAYGNTASVKNEASIAHPKQAALQGLAKMKLLMDWGIPQAILLPHSRPNLMLLHELGFRGNAAKMLKDAQRAHPKLLSAVYSASGMWTANAATVSPLMHARDGKVHLTPANLQTNLHRFHESDFNYKQLSTIFSDESEFKVHAPLPRMLHFADEGAANHSFITRDYDQAGLELFVYGRSYFDQVIEPKKYPARQTLEASEAIVRRHDIGKENALFVQQSPVAIDQGAFHNDVVFVSNKDVLLCHEHAFIDTPKALKAMQQAFNGDLCAIVVSEKKVSLEKAVESYLFNSQLLSLPNGKMVLLAPTETEKMPETARMMEEIVAGDNPIEKVHYVNCRESMKNGGGPACLRLRVVMRQTALSKLSGRVVLTLDLHDTLKQWVRKHYRDQLVNQDLLDPLLVEESERALDELTQILELGTLYPFQ